MSLYESPPSQPGFFENALGYASYPFRTLRKGLDYTADAVGTTTAAAGSVVGVPAPAPAPAPVVAGGRRRRRHRRGDSTKKRRGTLRLKKGRGRKTRAVRRH